ncbi:anthocyanin 5-aromatic acyltransferase-like [Humulus lupulus]|uniref:anthocyanin 5-aromatic acyltransferase-like n=1 Tax=Humulus lupulus TaxID=3486 RepID=UPI002B412E68|nr:anthocyanin 5-aromatic acyltransferase-like [Humulus lupulus]
MATKVLEECSISPAGPPITSPPSPPSSTALPLTFLDIPWLFFPPSRPLFFYNFPHPLTHFTSTLVPKLKLSLSLALRHFYPFAAALLLPPIPPSKPHIVAGPHDSVEFTVAESDSDFDQLSGLYSQIDAAELRALAPPLLPRAARANMVPLMAVRVTVFPNSGFCLGLALNHVVADARTFNNFMKLWSTFCVDHHHDRSSLPCYDRTVIVDTRGLEGVFLNEWWKRRTLSSSPSRVLDNGACDDELVRTSFVLGFGEMDKIKSRIRVLNLEQQPKHSQLLDLISPYVVTCAFLWVCVLKTQERVGQDSALHHNDEDPNYFGFIAGGLTRFEHPVPVTYLGNCVGFGRAKASRGELLGEYGLVVAARAIKRTVIRLDEGFLGEADRWISEWAELIGSDIHVMACGSPKVDFYGRDFGWGKPKKIEEIEIDSTKAISLSESRDVKGGIEIGLVLPKLQMDAFTLLFKEGLMACY